MRNLEVLNPKWNVSIKALPSRLRDLCITGGAKMVRTRGDKWLQGNSLPETIVLTHVWTKNDCDSPHRSSQAQAKWGASIEREKRTWGLTPNDEAVCNWYPLTKGRSVSFNGVTGYTNHTSGQALCQEAVGPHNPNSKVFLSPFFGYTFSYLFSVCCDFNLCVSCFMVFCIVFLQ